MPMPLGHKHSHETKQKIATALKGRKRSEETKDKIRKSMKGKKNRRGTGRDFIVTDPQGNSYYVKNLRDFCRQHFPDNWGNVQCYITLTAKTKGTFLGGWTAQFVIKEE